MNLADALNRGKLNIQHSVKHKAYDKTIQHRKFYLKCITGENIESLLQQFERNEDDTLFKQRQGLTIENLSPTVAPVLNKYYRVSRIIARKDITSSDKTGLKTLKEDEANFYSGNDVENYIASVIDDISQYDPNAFLTMGYQTDEKTGKIETYPVIFNCDEVHDFHFTRKGVLDYLFVAYPTRIYDKTSAKHADLIDFYFIVKTGTIHFQQIHEYREFAEGDAVTDPDWSIPGGNRRYRIVTNVTGTDEDKSRIPAWRIGYRRDKSNPTICVAPLHAAKPHLRDLIRHKSNYDISMLLHVFPKLFQYGDPCPGEVARNASWTCDGGIISGTNRKCRTCGGLGFKPHRSAQEVIWMRFPKPGDDKPMPLRDMAFYLSPDIAVVDRLGQELEKLERKVYVACFSTDSVRRANQEANEPGTATEADIKRDDINDTLAPYGDHRSGCWRFIVECMAQFNGVEVETVHEYPKTYEVETVEELLTKIDLLSKSNVSEIIIQELELLVAKQQFDNDPDALKRFTIWRRFRPFKGKTDAVIIDLMASSFVPRSVKVLYANFDVIQSRIEADDAKKFYDKKYADQESEVLEWAKKLADEIDKDPKEEILPLNPAKEKPAPAKAA